MACGVTLKRTLDFDPLMNQASPKRRRCTPVMSPVSSPQKYLRMDPSPFGEVSSRLTTGQKMGSIVTFVIAVTTLVSSGLFLFD